jgi:hypothetical protein
LRIKSSIGLSLVCQRGVMQLMNSGPKELRGEERST